MEGYQSARNEQNESHDQGTEAAQHQRIGGAAVTEGCHNGVISRIVSPEAAVLQHGQNGENDQGDDRDEHVRYPATLGNVHGFLDGCIKITQVACLCSLFLFFHGAEVQILQTEKQYH